MVCSICTRSFRWADFWQTCTGDGNHHSKQGHNCICLLAATPPSLLELRCIHAGSRPHVASTSTWPPPWCIAHRTEAYEKHVKVCSPANPGGPLGLPKGVTAGAPKAGSGGAMAGGRPGIGPGGKGGNYDTRPRAYMCYLCGGQYGSQRCEALMILLACHVYKKKSTTHITGSTVSV